MGEPLWPVMTVEQWRDVVEQTTRLYYTMRAHLGVESFAVRNLDLALALAFENLERVIEERSGCSAYGDGFANAGLPRWGDDL